MISRGRTLVGALVPCVLVVCAFAAVCASAAELTAVQCLNKGAGSKYSTAQCTTPAEAGNFETVAIPLNTPTWVTAKSTGETPALRATLGGVNITIKCESGELVGALLANRVSLGAHTIETTATRNTYTGCKAVLKANETRFCEVEEVTGPNPGTIGMISTRALESTTTIIEHRVRVEPIEGGEIAKFNILSKVEKPGNECFFNSKVSVSVTGAVEGEANTSNHAHLTFTEANNGFSLQANGGAAKYLDTVGGTAEGAVVGAETFT